MTNTSPVFTCSVDGVKKGGDSIIISLAAEYNIGGMTF